MLIAVLALCWDAAARLAIVDPFYLPPLARLFDSLLAAVADGRLSSALASSLLRGLAGYLLGVVLGIGVGSLAGRHIAVYRLLEPLLELLRPLPAPALLPLAILLLGIGSAMKVFVVAWACFFPILVATIDGVRGVRPALVETAQTLGVGYARMHFGVLLPAAAPTIFTGLRVAISLMLILTVISEMVAGNSGIGFLILEAERSFRVADMYAFIFVLAATGYLLNRLFLAVDRRVLWWHHRLNRLAAR